ncbi:hypothetical protein [Clostridium sp. MD294]|uniref:hypothetical protein n=1 Tax=Clostridium sp. MD294 TaxID=97138 RepID=UPI0002C91B91|nr:hypothetical protein [Clostridium sp. MD294]NDO47515.1 hypothetical protein [Clostridium sp. MD294]USF29413.1 hypothetical protein C820_000804 [Clostridium sp. MD294]
MYQNIKKKIAIFIVLLMLLCNTITAFASEQKGYLLPEQSILIDRSDIFVTILNDSLLEGYEVEYGLQMPLLINFRPVETAEDTLLYQGEWGAAKMAIFADKQTQRLQSVALILPREYVLNGYSQGSLDYFASIGILAGFFNGANANGIDGTLLRQALDFFNFDFYTLQSQQYTVGNLNYYYEVGAGSITFMITGVPQTIQ